MVEKVKRIWLEGEFIDWDDAKVHILTHWSDDIALH